MDELIKVDFNDKEIGFVEKMEAHRIPCLHRAFSIFIYKVVDNKVYMLLQRRADDKYHSGGLWSNACCSHPRKGESLEEAVIRRMEEELGIKTDVRELFSFTYFHRFSDDCAEYEYDHVFVGSWTENIYPDSKEISDVAWVEISELKHQMMESPDLFSYWFMVAAPKVIDLIYREASI